MDTGIHGSGIQKFAGLRMKGYAVVGIQKGSGIYGYAGPRVEEFAGSGMQDIILSSDCIFSANTD